jgi:hypothetical protein
MRLPMFKSTETALAGLLTSGPLAALSWVDKVDLIIRWGAGIGATVASVMTFLYYLDKYKNKK